MLEFGEFLQGILDIRTKVFFLEFRQFEAIDEFFCKDKGKDTGGFLLKTLIRVPDQVFDPSFQTDKRGG